MIDSFYIAWKYISFNKIKTIILVACITLILFLPIALQLLLDESERQLMARAVDTPLVVGKKGRNDNVADSTTDSKFRKKIGRFLSHGVHILGILFRPAKV